MAYKKLIQVLALFATVLSLAACGKSGNSKQETRAGGARTAGTVQAVGSMCTNGTSAIGYIYADGVTNFQDEVRGLVSATLDPDVFGAVSGVPRDTTGIDLRLDVDRASATVRSIQLVIYDEFVGTKDSTGQVIQPYPITVPKAAGGFVNAATRSLNLVFTDQHGDIRIIGQSNDGAVIEGTVEYHNRTHFAQGTPRNGTLGRFRLPLCALF